MLCSPALLYFSERTGGAQDVGASVSLKQGGWDHLRPGTQRQQSPKQERRGSQVPYAAIGTCRKEWSPLFVANSSPFSQSLNTTRSFLNQLGES